VFALQHTEPRHGLFVPFYMIFLNHWNDPRHPSTTSIRTSWCNRDAGEGRRRGELLGVPIDGSSGPRSAPVGSGAGGASSRPIVDRTIVY